MNEDKKYMGIVEWLLNVSNNNSGLVGIKYI